MNVERRTMLTDASGLVGNSAKFGVHLSINNSIETLDVAFGARTGCELVGCHQHWSDVGFSQFATHCSDSEPLS